MVDPISIAKDVISFGMKIKQIIDEVKAFKEYAKRVQFKIEHLMPPLETITEMENQREALAAAQKSEPEMKAFTKSLSQMLSLMEEIKSFIESLKGMSKFQQATKKENIKEKFETYDSKFDTLQRSIHMGVLVEFKKEADAARQDSVKILVRHLQKASASHRILRASRRGKYKLSLSDDIPIIASDDLEAIRKLGKGGFGAVWLSKYRETERVAVKIFDVGNNSSILKEVAKMRQAIFSSYIVRLRGLVDEPGTQGIVMDYFEYGSLKSFLPYLECDCWPRRVRMLCDIASGINYLHNELQDPLVHRDIKLSNMFVDRGFTVKIGDLGLASSGTTVTKPRSQVYLMGTYSHMAPEVWDCKAEDVEPSLDIYGFGISIYEFITGKSPWPPAVKPDEIRGLVLSGKRPNLAYIKAKTPHEVLTMMQWCWHTDPKLRPTSQDILNTVTELFEEEYERGLRRADKTINDQIDLVQEAHEARSPKESSSVAVYDDDETESDFFESFGQMSVNDEDNTLAATAKSAAITPLKSFPFKEKPGQGVVEDHGYAVASPPEVWSGSDDDTDQEIHATKDEADRTWQFLHSINLDGSSVMACHMISQDHLAVCMEKGCVMVYHVSGEGSNLAYTVKSKDWKTLIKWKRKQEWKDIYDVAVSESLPGCMLVICEDKPYVYLCPCYETTKVYEKYKIKSDEKSPYCIVANADTAVIAMYNGSSFLVCRLPGFTEQSCVQIDFDPYDLSISSDYLLVMGEKEMLLRALSNVIENVCRMKPPTGWTFTSVCCRDNAREIFVACVQGAWFNGKGSVYRYTWDGVGNPIYGYPTCIIEDLSFVLYKRLSVTWNGLLAVGQYSEVKIYDLSLGRDEEEDSSPSSSSLSQLDNDVYF